MFFLYPSLAILAIDSDQRVIKVRHDQRSTRLGYVLMSQHAYDTEFG
jgi:hypothetical protein